jgi:hypothetical protein
MTTDSTGRTEGGPNFPAIVKVGWRLGRRRGRRKQVTAMGPGRDGVDASPTALVCQSGGVSHH